MHDEKVAADLRKSRRIRDLGCQKAFSRGLRLHSLKIRLGTGPPDCRLHGLLATSAAAVPDALSSEAESPGSMAIGSQPEQSEPKMDIRMPWVIPALPWTSG